MSFYTEVSGISDINTIATDFTGDGMLFYRNGDHFSDGGYYYYEIEMVYQHKAKRICEAIAHSNFVSLKMRSLSATAQIMIWQ
ncbi:hypothetical protein LP065_00020 [Latilactobacillus sakei]|uniref:hypothetical protein n=1 Tax=Latilactobacillus sakei TaxID=1599 RepID=UPI000A17ACB3|nr:hypothetical protein [Latilactobacillus sakei]ARJ71034.1 hypothetical protein LP065_00020 [Latilactobacillus sakei]